MARNKGIIIIGYSGHAFVLCDILRACNRPIIGYCDSEIKTENPFHLDYLGKEMNPDVKELIEESSYFIAIGNNQIRRNLFEKMAVKNGTFINAIHPSSIVSEWSDLQDGIMIGARVVINPQVKIGRGVICNTGSIIEHECEIGDFCHIAPSAVLCGAVKVGANSFIGANSVVRQGIRVGENVLIGAGSVVVKDVADHSILVGNPAKDINTKIKSKLFLDS